MHRHQLAPLVFVFLLAPVIFGCANNADQQLPFPGLSARFTDQVLQDENRFAHLRSSHYGSRFLSKNDIKAIAGTPKPLQDYVDGLVQRLTNATKLPHPQMYVSISSCAGFGEHNIAFEGVAICTSTLAVLNKDSELAFLIAHETCHLLLRHGEEDAGVVDQQRAKAAKQYSITGFGIWSQPFMKTNALNENALRVRQQEVEADLCGVDLMAEAGFNLNGALSLMDVIIQWENKKRADEAQRNEERPRSILNQIIEAINFVSPHTPGKLYEKYLSDARTHKSADGRAADLRKYIKGVYGGGGAALLHQLPWRLPDADPTTVAFIASQTIKRD